MNDKLIRTMFWRVLSDLPDCLQTGKSSVQLYCEFGNGNKVGASLLVGIVTVFETNRKIKSI